MSSCDLHIDVPALANVNWYSFPGEIPHVPGLWSIIPLITQTSGLINEDEIFTKMLCVTAPNSQRSKTKPMAYVTFMK